MSVYTDFGATAVVFITATNVISSCTRAASLPCLNNLAMLHFVGLNVIYFVIQRQQSAAVEAT